MLKEILEYVCGNSIKKTQEEMKVVLSEIKKNIQGTSSGGDEADIQIDDLEHKEDISIHAEQQEERRIQKNQTKTQNKMRTV